MKALLAVVVCTILAAGMNDLSAQTPIAGDWQGVIALPGIDLGIIVHISGPGDSLHATIDIPMQMAKGLPLKNVRATPPEVHFELPAGPGLAVFDGSLAGDSITGDFRQAGIAARFRLHKSGEAASVVAAPPPPFREEEVRITSGDIMLAGTLSVPPAGGPFPAVILLTGSGAQNRDEEIFGFAPFRILADHLTRNGYAVLRCDDRGVGGSTGNTTASTTADFSHDAQAMLAYLQTRAEIKHDAIGVLGHSEGAAVAAMAATASDDVAFAILLAAPALRGDSTILSQIRLLMRSQGASDDEIAHALALQEKVFVTIRRQEGWDELRTGLMAEMRRSLDRVPPEQRTGISNPDSTLGARVDIQMNAVRTPWFTFFVSFDPAPVYARMRCPVLALFGELDMQVAPSSNLPRIQEAFSQSGNPDAEVATITGANHLFQKAVTGSPAEYAGLEKVFAAGVLDRLTGWLKKHFP